VLSERGDRLLYARDHRLVAGAALPRPGSRRGDRRRSPRARRGPGKLTLGSDNGTALTSRAFRARLVELGVVHRRGGYRDPESQAFIESWFGKFKQRCVWREEFETLDEARSIIGGYVDRYHHGPRSRLAYRTPREVAATWKVHDDHPVPAA
jgi:transposase InsO family protein